MPIPPSRRHIFRRVALLIALAIALVAGACAGGPPEVPLGADGVADPVLVEGRSIFSDRCTNCHGSAGGGGRGPKLSDGKAVELYPEVTDHVTIVTDGKNGQMPGFGGVLSEQEILAVVRYTREVL